MSNKDPITKIESEYIQSLITSLSNAVSKNIEGTTKMGIVFSGGLDSSLIALLSKNCAVNTSITLYTVGTANSHDLLNVDEAVKILNMKSKKIEIHSDDIQAAIPELARIIESKNPVKISFELPLYLCLANIEEKVVLSGQGADELFGGYARYLRMEPDEMKVALSKDLEKLMAKDIKMDYKIAEHFNKILKTPYLDEEVVRTASRIPIENKVNEGMRKIVLKEAARQVGLNLNLVNKEKKASQYSSGMIKELRRMSKAEGMHFNEYIEALLREKG